MGDSISAIPSIRVLRFSRNLHGRDFVVGDLHGAYTTLLAAMKQANFDGSVDRLFPVGDLIDRGADSWRCARFLRQPYVPAAVRGNHEDMLIELYRDGVPHEDVLRAMARFNGFGWWLDTTPEQRAEILAAVIVLPLVIELETSRGMVGIVHADVPAGMDWPTFVREIEAGNPEVTQTALWGRDRIQSGNTDGVRGIGRVFVGHTPQWNGLQRLGNVYAVDTGAIFGESGRKQEGRLTMAEMACKTEMLVEPRSARLIDVRANLEAGPETSTEPFGNYAR